MHKGLDVPAFYWLGQAEAKAAIITLDLMPKDSFELDFYQLHIGNTRSHRTSLGRPHGDWVGVTSLPDEEPEQVEASAHDPDTNDEEYMCNDDHSDDHDNDGIQGCASMNDLDEAQLNDLAEEDSTLTIQEVCAEAATLHKYTNTIDIGNGKIVHKSTALRLIFSSDPKSTDRLK